MIFLGWNRAGLGVKMSRIIFLDIDGTIADYENRIPESAIFAMKKARENGHKVYMCTGRSQAEIPEKLWKIGFDGMIGGNGSYVENHEKVVFHQLISLEQCTEIVDWLQERELEFYLESNNGLFASKRFEEKALPVMQEYARRKGDMKSNNVTVRGAFEGMVFGGELYRDDVNKVSYILNTHQDYLDTMEHFPLMKNGTWGGKGETALFGDISPANITKARAIEALLSYLGCDNKDTIAFGDAKVDIPMLQYCALGVAMGNGSEDIKAVADYVTDDVECDGLYKAFVKFGLI